MDKEIFDNDSDSAITSPISNSTSNLDQSDIFSISETLLNVSGLFKFFKKFFYPAWIYITIVIPLIKNICHWKNVWNLYVCL